MNEKDNCGCGNRLDDVGASAAFSQVKMTKDQMMFYTSDWKGDRFPDGRPKVPDDLLKRATDCTD